MINFAINSVVAIAILLAAVYFADQKLLEGKIVAKFKKWLDEA